MTLPLDIERQIAAETGSDIRTVRLVWLGVPRRKRSSIRERIAVALTNAGFPPAQGSNPAQRSAP